MFCNPPYGREIARWVRKCYEESRKGALVVMLIPARTDTAYFHDYIYHTEYTEGRGLGFDVYSPCRTAMVLEKTEE